MSDPADSALDTAALSSFLDREVGPADSLDVTGEGGGYSNETLFVTWGDRELVVRRPPPDETADTAHDVLREYRILDALQGTAVPVAPTVASCDDESILGAPFYVMDRVAGDVIYTEEPERFATPTRREALADAFVDALVAVHDVDYDAVGLVAGDFGYPEGYLERQVERFQEAVIWAVDTTSEEREVPELYEVGSWLAENVPGESDHALVHGDYKLDNVMFAPDDEPHIAGVFDWEMSTLGDPLADLGYALHFWPDEMAPDGGTDVVADERFAPSFLAHGDYPTRTEFVARYERRSGREFENRRFYLALAAFKMAALGEMFYARYLRGGVDDPMYERMGEGVPAQAERALAIIDGEWTV
ncbi:phosphotransferase family protein [Haloglomus litoreum]|uniref:phosphotransferase family protein n=1 Tax=Haloglomus litoreum TaxID=3034026 RepID=UPI0023E89A44|nr:phosphotransferase family protein [Haloglomus sp. DT116]